ncbi:hypothetical protein F8M41_020958 [Gigaspora margarita]|uniref:Uncharacterized protein n=1 Tax=Gigaspora margarita TaxID=4874 RepID=A0A8H4AHI8_GIGMA|nr:hypothetical protein F8M41_020958 [Gigaspora margarita]
MAVFTGWVGSGAKPEMCFPNASEAFALNFASFYFILTTIRFVSIDENILPIICCDSVSHPVGVLAATREGASILLLMLPFRSVDFLSTRIHEIGNITLKLLIVFNNNARYFTKKLNIFEILTIGICIKRKKKQENAKPYFELIEGESSRKLENRFEKFCAKWLKRKFVALGAKVIRTGCS